jgi:hypothetical protein
VISAIRETAEMADEWGKDYLYDNHTNEYYHKTFREKECSGFSGWFDLK